MIYTREQVIADILKHQEVVVSFAKDLNTNLLFSDFCKHDFNLFDVNSLKEAIDTFTRKHGFTPLESLPDIEEGFLYVFVKQDDKFKPFCSVKKMDDISLKQCFQRLDEENKTTILVLNHDHEIVFRGYRKTH